MRDHLMPEDPGVPFSEAIGGMALAERIGLCIKIAELVSDCRRKGRQCPDIVPENIIVHDNGNRVRFTDGRDNTDSAGGSSPDKDITALGEAVFLAVFGRMPKITERRSSSKYPFGRSEFSALLSRPDIRNRFDVFFRSTIRASGDGRFSTPEEAAEKLKELSELLRNEMYVIPELPSALGEFLDREREFEQLRRSLKTERCVFIIGEEGAGKSAFVREFCIRSAEDHDIAVYLESEYGAARAFMDDEQLRINTVRRVPEENDEDYFRRKLKCFRELSEGMRVLLVVDGLSGEADEALDELLDPAWEVIAVTRAGQAPDGYTAVEIGPFPGTEERYRMIVRYLGRQIRPEEKDDADKFISCAGANTLILGLAGRLVSARRISFADLAVKLEKDCGLTAVIEKLVNIMEPDEITMMKAVSLFGAAGVDSDLFYRLIGITKMDTVINLAHCGWVLSDGQRLMMHPLLAETVRGMEWSEDDIRWTDMIMARLSNVHDHHAAEMMLRTAADIRALCSGIGYGALAYDEVKSLPSYRDKFRELLLKSLVNCRDLALSRRMDVFERLVTLYAERKDFESAKRYIRKNNVYLTVSVDVHMVGWRKWFWSKYNLELLNGAFVPQTAAEISAYSELMRNLDLAVWALERRGDVDAPKVLPKARLCRANVLIRSGQYKKTIADDLEKLKRELFREPDTLLELEYCKLCALYHSVTEPDMDKMLKDMLKARELAEKLVSTDLELIEVFLIPFANMLYYLKDYDGAEEMTELGIELCRKHSGIAPYERITERLKRALADIRDAM